MGGRCKEISKKISESNKGLNFSSCEKIFHENDLAMKLFGSFHSHLAKIENAFGGSIYARGNQVTVSGSPETVDASCAVLETLYSRLQRSLPVDLAEVDAAIRMKNSSKDNCSLLSSSVKTKRGYISARSNMQSKYLEAIKHNELVFGQGPAGTGKTFLAVAVAVEKLVSGAVDRIVLSRPAVEAGEQLGFLPGDMREKVDPYLRPLYDALYCVLPERQVLKRFENNEIELAPLAFMRGRTLSNAFIILDEAQNTTAIQMKMFLTRLGENSQMVVTGDLTQVDLPSGIRSGLKDALETLSHVKGVEIVNFKETDVVRNAMVTRMVQAYRRIDKKRNNEM